MMRSVGAIAAGFVFIALLSFGADSVLRTLAPDAFSAAGRVDSLPVLLVIQGYVALFAITGCYIAATLAGRRPMLHALVLGLLGLVFNIVGVVVLWDTAPAWYHLLALALVMPYAWIGGRLRLAQVESGEARPALARAPAGG